MVSRNVGLKRAQEMVGRQGSTAGLVPAVRVGGDQDGKKFYFQSSRRPAKIFEGPDGCEGLLFRSDEDRAAAGFARDLRAVICIDHPALSD